MYNHKASLVPMTSSINSYGDPVETAGTLKPVYCRVTSADEKEKAFANSRGESAELVIIIPDKKMYSGEKYVQYNNTNYRVTDVKFTDTSKEIRLVVGKWETH